MGTRLGLDRNPIDRAIRAERTGSVDTIAFITPPAGGIDEALMRCASIAAHLKKRAPLMRWSFLPDTPHVSATHTAVLRMQPDLLVFYLEPDHPWLSPEWTRLSALCPRATKVVFGPGVPDHGSALELLRVWQALDGVILTDPERVLFEYASSPKSSPGSRRPVRTIPGLLLRGEDRSEHSPAETSPLHDLPSPLASGILDIGKDVHDVWLEVIRPAHPALRFLHPRPRAPECWHHHDEKRLVADIESIVRHDVPYLTLGGGPLDIHPDFFERLIQALERLPSRTALGLECAGIPDRERLSRLVSIGVVDIDIDDSTFYEGITKPSIRSIVQDFSHLFRVHALIPPLNGRPDSASWVRVLDRGLKMGVRIVPEHRRFVEVPGAVIEAEQEPERATWKRANETPPRTSGPPSYHRIGEGVLKPDDCLEMERVLHYARHLTHWFPHSLRLLCATCLMPRTAFLKKAIAEDDMPPAPSPQSWKKWLKTKAKQFLSQANMTDRYAILSELCDYEAWILPGSSLPKRLPPHRIEMNDLPRARLERAPGVAYRCFLVDIPALLRSSTLEGIAFNKTCLGIQRRGKRPPLVRVMSSQEINLLDAVRARHPVEAFLDSPQWPRPGGTFEDPSQAPAEACTALDTHGITDGSVAQTEKLRILLQLEREGWLRVRMVPVDESKHRRRSRILPFRKPGT